LELALKVNRAHPTIILKTGISVITNHFRTPSKNQYIEELIVVPKYLVNSIIFTRTLRVRRLIGSYT